MWEERAPARLIFHTDKCLLSYREQEAELLYLSYLLWWHTEPWARRGGPWWLLPLCGDRGLWSGKEKKRILFKGWSVDTDRNEPQHSCCLPHRWAPAVDTSSLSSLPHPGWIHKTPLESGQRDVPAGRLVPHTEECSSLQYKALLSSQPAKRDKSVLVQDGLANNHLYSYTKTCEHLPGKCIFNPI